MKKLKPFHQNAVRKIYNLFFSLLLICAVKTNACHLNAADLLLSGRFMNLSDDIYFLMAGSGEMVLAFS
jgi:hypothetical protein